MFAVPLFRNTDMAAVTSRENTLFNKLMSVFHASVLFFSNAVIDHELRHNIVKVAVDPRGDSRMDPHVIALFFAITKRRRDQN